MVTAGWRLLSETGPWKGLDLLSPDPNRFLGSSIKDDEKENIII